MKILAPSDSLLHAFGHVSHSASRQSLRCADTWLIIHRHPDLDWALLLDCARPPDWLTCVRDVRVLGRESECANSFRIPELSVRCCIEERGA